MLIDLLKLGFRLVLLLLLLSLGLVNLHGHAFNSIQTTQYTTTQKICDAQAQFKPVTSDSAASLEGKPSSSDVGSASECVNQIAGSSHDSTHYHDTEMSVQWNTFRRILSNDQDASSDLEPVYHLLIDFFPPSLLALVLAAVPLLDSKLHWTSLIQSPPSRLSGWKEGNIQYSHFRDSIY
ncbi:hypothetical protein ACFFUS_07405 [Vibrio gallaecicus]|uniref:hypothetical protein n=1 Tax=Vibrio gallaecicus TaxID=552386 RepID=UPI0010C96BA5|nr:hypothetical protein [Vibrio gallaecicus]MDN3616191.1 hypothetical protein [Vibrio gallaecicus]